MATAVAEQQRTVNPMETLRGQLERRSEELKRALPTHIPPERFIRVVQTAASLNTELLTVNRQSLWNACMRAAQDGLLPDGREGAIVPFKDNNSRSPTNGQVIAQWMPMAYGLLKRFRNSGQFKSVTANIVHEKDEFSYWIDEHGEHLKHVPLSDEGQPVKAYAVAVLKGGGTMIKVMSHAEIEKRRAVSRAKDGPMWREWWDEAAMKTVLRNLAKRLPTSSDLDDLIRRDDALYSFDTAAAERNTPGIRAHDVAGALDYFSGADPNAPVEETSGDGGTIDEEPQQQQQPSEQASEPQGSDDAANAFKEGAKARKAGQTRKAVPPEYRTPEASEFAREWLKGWDSAG